MSEPQRNLQDLNQGGKESLRALIQAIAPETKDGGGHTLDRLTEKLSELIGVDAEEEFKQQRNERGELVNEEGLPIIDITEPVEAKPPRRSTASLPPPVSVEPLIKLSSLSETAQARLKEQRNRILDLLEEEERQLELQAIEREEQRKRDDLQRQREDAARDKDRAKEARELQKKMGRALLKNVGLAREKEREELELQKLKDEEMERRKSPSAKKKTVAFADSVQSSSDSADNNPQEHWGDITPATLRRPPRPTLLSQEKQPMKMNVVERVPGGKPTITPSSLLQDDRIPDSDDESDQMPFESSDEDENDDEEPELEADDVDYDYARHQREIALEYFKKRDHIGQAAAAALKNHSHDEVPTENSDILNNPHTPVISQFKANRLAAAYQSSNPKANTSKASSSLGDSVLPASGTRTIQRSIRTGRLNADGKLVGGEADSASEDEDQQLQEVLDLIRRGEMLNVGPDNKYLTTIPPLDPWQQNESTAESRIGPVQTSKKPPTSELPPPTVHSKSSKFKASRAAAGRPNGSLSFKEVMASEVRSMSTTPVSNLLRSSPKSATPIDEGQPELPFVAPTYTSSALPPQFSMIVESPDFPRPSHLLNQATTTSARASSQLRPEQPPAVLSSFVKESSSSTAPSVVHNPKSPELSGAITPDPKSRRPVRPPTVLSAKVIEASKHTQLSEEAESSAPKKVSRFKAERMQ
ncbi:hypothetical protein CVT24_011511 [Panaeolus cyanescens]|uniref:DUF3835 domain-containing protein n=1 Tax=Panaeolus cyanescens TaxID=181874 RepID=A0A409VMF7_9AGAR|nr:hypothetical protein CVT24_011511 [Panaeolus cyanescens]